MKADVHPRQGQRLAALQTFGVLDTPREGDFDDIVALASAICETPISVINLIDDGRQWFKAEVGLGVRQTPLESSLCAHAILENDFLEVPDTLSDDRMCDNPLCLAENGLRFYAGALLKTHDGLPIGTLCVLDTKPRRLTALQVQALKTLSHQVMAQLELRLALRRQQLLLKESDHRVKNSLQSIVGMLELKAARASHDEVRKALREASDRVSTVSLLHKQLYLSDDGGAVDAEAYLRGLAELLGETAPPDVTITAACTPLSLDARQATALGVIVTEFALNSIKHAFVDRPGSITVRLEPGADGLMTLTCRDDGPGLPADSMRRKGLGLRIMAASAENLGGAVRTVPGLPGHGIQVAFVAQSP